MPRPSRSARRSLAFLVEPATQTDFSDPESQRVLEAAADAVAYELGLEAGREYFTELLAAQRKGGPE
jgi:hypothetical protein